MKKLSAVFFFAVAAICGALVSYASVCGIFEAFGVGTELLLLCLGFATAMLFSYATVKTAVS